MRLELVKWMTEDVDCRKDKTLAGREDLGSDRVIRVTFTYQLPLHLCCIQP